MPQDLRAMARRVTPGMSLALPVDYAGVSMAMTRPLIEHGAGGLHLVCVPTGGLQVDMLIGAGLVATVETSALSLGEAGGAPRFNDAVRQGGIRILDATCPAIHPACDATLSIQPVSTWMIRSSAPTESAHVAGERRSGQPSHHAAEAKMSIGPTAPFMS